MRWNLSIQKANDRFKFLEIGAILLTVFLVIRWFYCIDTYTVNLLYKDQWDFYGSLFKNESYWSSFQWQMGSHRMGLGLVLTRLLAEWSEWNTRVECFGIGTLVTLATLFFLVLKRKLSGGLVYTDVVIPMLCLNTAQHSIFTGTPFMSHGAMPLLLISLYCLAWLLKGNLKYPAILILNFLLIFTGYGFFIGIITIVLLTVEFVRYRKNSKLKNLYVACGLLVSFLSVFLFFVNYRFNIEAAPSGSWYMYLVFVFKGLGKFVSSGGSYLGVIVGLLVFATLFALCVVHFARLIKGKQTLLSRVIAILTAYTLLYLAAVSYGRAFLEQNVDGAYASRYIIHFIPGAIGVYLHTLGSSRLQNVLKQSVLVLLLFLSFHTQDHFKYMEWFRYHKTVWKETYLETENIGKANKAAGIHIYAKSRKAKMKREMAYLKENKLNLYSE